MNQSAMQGSLKAMQVLHNDVGRSVEEAMRLLDAFQYVEENGVVRNHGAETFLHITPTIRYLDFILTGTVLSSMVPHSSETVSVIPPGLLQFCVVSWQCSELWSNLSALAGVSSQLEAR